MDEAREKDVRGSDEQNKEYDQQHRSITVSRYKWHLFATRCIANLHVIERK